jgi:hypothetical protein
MNINSITPETVKYVVCHNGINRYDLFQVQPGKSIFTDLNMSVFDSEEQAFQAFPKASYVSNIQKPNDCDCSLADITIPVINSTI